MSDTRTDKSAYNVRNDGLLCSASTLLSSLLNLTEYYLQTRPKQSMREIVTTIHENKFRGLGVNLFSNVYYHTFLLTVKHYTEKSLDKINPSSAVNEQAAGLAGGAAAPITSYPLSVIQAWRCEGVSIRGIFNMNPDSMFKGFRASCLGDSLFYGTYFSIHPALSNYRTDKDIVTDVVSGLFSGLICNPFYVISNCQKTSNQKMIQQGKTLFKEGGLKRFYTGFGTVSLLNLGLFGLTAGAGDRLVKRIFEEPMARIRCE